MRSKRVSIEVLIIDGDPSELRFRGVFFFALVSASCCFCSIWGMSPRFISLSGPLLVPRYKKALYLVIYITISVA